MLRNLFVSVILLGAMALHAECTNIHCRFEYLGSHIGPGYTEDLFLKESAVCEQMDKYCVEEYMLSLRRLNWCLYKLELAAASGKYSEVSNAVLRVSALLCGKADNKSSGYPNSLKLMMLEKIEYSLARMVLSDSRDIIVPQFQTLIPDSILQDAKEERSACSIRTFKQMLCLAVAIEDFHEREGCYPLNLDTVGVPESLRKCAFGRDIEYECYKGIWVLRCRCESWGGGLKFDEYIPMVYQQRRRLDLCFSSTFNEKRKSLYNGESMSADDMRIAGRVIHESTKSGVHAITFSKPNAGNVRIVPMSEVNSTGKNANSFDLR